MFRTADTEEAAAQIVACVESEIAPGLVVDGAVQWNAINDSVYRMLSSGEKACIDLARHVSARVPARDNASFLLAFSKLDRKNQAVVANALLGLFAKLDLVDVL